MHILWIHQYYATPDGWGSARTYEFARLFAAAGHTVDVVCSTAYDASLRPGRQDVMPGVRLFVSRVRYRPHMGYAARLAAFAGFMAFALRVVLWRGRRYDLAIVSSAPLATAFPALAGRCLWRLPYVFEVIDVWPDAAVAAGVLRNPVALRLALHLEARAYRRAARIVTCSTAMTARVIGKGVPPDKVVTIANGCDMAQFRPDAAVRTAQRTRMGLTDDHLVCLYTGAMGVSNAIGDLEQAVRLTAGDARIVWWFVGDGPAAGRLHSLAGECERVRVFGALPRRALPALFAAADVAVISFLHAPLFYENSPNKFFDAIAAGLPVLFNRSTWLEPWLERYGNAIVCRDDPPAPALAAALQRLTGDPALRARMGAAARRLAREAFDREQLAVSYIEILEAASRVAPGRGRFSGR